LRQLLRRGFDDGHPVLQSVSCVTQIAPPLLNAP